MGASETWSAAEFNTWSFIFLFYILTIFLKLYQTNVILFSFSNEMSINIINSNLVAFRNNINEVFREINEWFKSNLLSLNYDKTYCFAICS